MVAVISFAGLPRVGGTMSGNITMLDTKWVGMGASKGRLVFSDAAVDELKITDSLLKITDGTRVFEIFADVTNGNGIGTFSNNDFIVYANSAEIMRMQRNSNVIINSTVQSAVGTGGEGVLMICSDTAPSTSPADSLQIFCTDISAGNATLGLRTETAVAADVGLASTHSLTIKINGSAYKLPLVFVA